jgi:histidinol-phosphatase
MPGQQPPKTPKGWLTLLSEIADEADDIALRHFGRADLAVQVKPDDSPVTEADQAIETEARRIMSHRAPGVGVYGEEEGETGSTDRRLIIDPIDATRNFMRGIPVFATLLAIEEDGEVIAGVVSAPALHARWRAARGIGAFRRDRAIHVSAITEVSDALIFHSDMFGATEKAPPSGYQALARRAARTRGFGDFYQHVLVAQGSGELAVDPKVSPWDIAPLMVLVEEAGGKATDMTGTRTIYGRSFVTSNGAMHDEAIAALTDR